MFGIWCLNILVLLIAIGAVNGYRIKHRSAPVMPNAKEEITKVKKQLEELTQSGNIALIQGFIDAARANVLENEAGRSETEKKQLLKVLQNYEEKASPELKEEREQRERAQAKEHLSMLKERLASMFETGNLAMVRQMAKTFKSMYLQDDTKTEEERHEALLLISDYEIKAEDPAKKAEYEKVMKQKSDAEEAAYALIQRHMDNGGKPTSDDTTVKKQLNDAIDALTMLSIDCDAAFHKESLDYAGNDLTDLVTYLEYPVARRGKDEANALLKEAKELEASGKIEQALEKFDAAKAKLDDAVNVIQTYIRGLQTKQGYQDKPTYQRATAECADANRALKEINAELAKFKSQHATVIAGMKRMERSQNTKEKDAKTEAKDDLSMLKERLAGAFETGNLAMVRQMAKTFRSAYLQDDTKTKQEKREALAVISNYEIKAETPEVKAEYEKVMEQKGKAEEAAYALIQRHMDNEGQPTSEDTSVKKQLNDAVDALTEFSSKCHAKFYEENASSQSNVLQNLLAYLEYPVARRGKDEANALLKEAKELESGNIEQAEEKFDAAKGKIRQAVDYIQTYVDGLEAKYGLDKVKDNPTWQRALGELAGAKKVQTEIYNELEALDVRQSSEDLKTRLMGDAHKLFNEGDYKKADTTIKHAIKCMQRQYARVDRAVEKMKMDAAAKGEEVEEGLLQGPYGQMSSIDAEIKNAKVFEAKIEKKLGTK